MDGFRKWEPIDRIVSHFYLDFLQFRRAVLFEDSPNGE